MNATPDLRFDVEWDAAPAVRADELRATWARFELWVDDECVTRVEDVQTRSARRSLYGSLYPLAEWIAYNWWFLKAHSRPASLPIRTWSYGRLAGNQTSLYRWLEHHNARAAGEGFAWPDLTIVPEGHLTRVTWRRDREARADRPVRFLAEGEAWVDTSNLEQALAGFVTAVVARLDERRVGGTALAKEWSELSSTPVEEAEFCTAAARLGLDPYTTPPEVEEQITRVAGQLDDRLLNDVLDAVRPDRLDNALAWIASSSRTVQERAGQAGQRLRSLRDDVHTSDPARHTKPWEMGWQQARQVRRVLGLEPAESLGLDDLLPVTVQRSGDRGLVALGGTAENRLSLLVLGREMVRQAGRFCQARALWNLLLEQSSERFLITSGHADRQKIERAFAAELLAPAEGIEQQLDANLEDVEVEDLEDAARRFGVSSVLIRHQIDNQLLV